jgi:hypothetical protein
MSKTSSDSVKPAVFVAVAYSYWGSGPTAEKAKKALVAAGYRARARNASGYIIKELPAGAYDAFVDEVGTIWWSGPNGACKVVVDTTKKAEKKTLQRG